VKRTYSQNGWKSLHWTALGLASAMLVGCAETTRQDVSDARQEAQEERQQLDEVRTDARDAVREEQQEAEQVRREAMKPVTEDTGEDIAREERDVEEARQEGDEAIREQKQDVQEAEKEADLTERKFQATKARDAYVEQAEAKLNEASSHIDALKAKGDSLEGDAKDANDKQVAQLETEHTQAKDALDELKSAEVLNWKQSQAKVDRELNDLSRAIEQTS
jgi:outer membrane murein-binding lipoprotein Lpp